MRSGWLQKVMAAGAILGALALPAVADEELRMWGTPPREQPHYTKSAEGFPPLPLPVTPMRRSEKKRPPRAPILIANVQDFGVQGWLGSPGAVQRLLDSGRQHLDIWYDREDLDIHTVVREFNAGADHRTPILYLCAYYPLNLDEPERKALQSYVVNGGTLLINCCGQDRAFASAQAELDAMFPHYELRLLPLDHPIYGSYFQVDKVKYPTPSKGVLDAAPGAGATDRPKLYAITMGSRAAVIVSHEDLACGWNQWNNPTVKRVAAEDSTRLGLNIITYVTAELRLAKFQARTQEIAGPNIRPRQQLTFAQIIHDGNWDPNPSAVPLFLKDLASNTSLAVRFDERSRQEIQLRDPALFTYPLLYLTGQWDPRFSKEERALLHRYLTSGGVLIADDAAGREEFDAAFRALMKDLFPEATLQVLPADHPLFSSFYKIGAVAANHADKPVLPTIEAIFFNGHAVVLYSKLGLGDGWARQFDAYARCYAAPDALKLGTNIVVYAMQ
jgi:hypothetical protein